MSDIPSLLELLTDRIVNHNLPVEEARAIVLRHHFYSSRPAAPAPKTMEQIKLGAIVDALARNGNNVTVTAAELQISKETIYRKVRDLR